MRFLKSFPVLVLVAVLSACSKSSPTAPTSPDPPTGKAMLRVIAMDNAGSLINSTANVKVEGGMSIQTVSDTTGIANLELPYGQYNVSVDAFGFDPATQPVDLDQPREDASFKLQRHNSLRVVSVDPLCGSTDVPYGAIKVKIEYSFGSIPFDFGQDGEYSLSLRSYLGTDSVTPIVNANGGTKLSSTTGGFANFSVYAFEFLRNPPWSVSSSSYILSSVAIINSSYSVVQELSKDVFVCSFRFK